MKKKTILVCKKIHTSSIRPYLDETSVQRQGLYNPIKLHNISCCNSKPNKTKLYLKKIVLNENRFSLRKRWPSKNNLSKPKPTTQVHSTQMKTTLNLFCHVIWQITPIPTQLQKIKQIFSRQPKKGKSAFGTQISHLNCEALPEGLFKQQIYACTKVDQISQLFLRGRNLQSYFIF